MFSEAWLCIKQGQANINKIIRFSFGFGMNLGLAKYETKFLIQIIRCNFRTMPYCSKIAIKKAGVVFMIDNSCFIYFV
jgi:hypothetical protein